MKSLIDIVALSAAFWVAALKLLSAFAPVVPIPPLAEAQFDSVEHLKFEKSVPVQVPPPADPLPIVQAPVPSELPAQVKRVEPPTEVSPPEPVADPVPVAAMKLPPFGTFTNPHLAELEAIARNRPVLAIFTQAGCEPCKLVENFALKDDLVKSYIADHYVLAVIDCDRYPKVADQFGVYGVPEVFIYVPGEKPRQRFVPPTDRKHPQRGVDDFLTELQRRET